MPFILNCNRPKYSDQDTKFPDCVLNRCKPSRSNLISNSYNEYNYAFRCLDEIMVVLLFQP